MPDKDFDIKDLSLAEKGRNRIQWSEQEMPVLRGRRSWAAINTRGNQNGLLEQERRREKTLIELEERADKYLPCHYFDVIGGTSTGGSVKWKRDLEPC